MTILILAQDKNYKLPAINNKLAQLAQGLKY